MSTNLMDITANIFKQTYHQTTPNPLPINHITLNRKQMNL